jgi:hypothetical protein
MLNEEYSVAELQGESLSWLSESAKDAGPHRVNSVHIVEICDVCF